MNYPYTGYILTTSFIVRECTFEASGTGWRRQMDVTDHGASHYRHEIFMSRDEAIAYGERRIREREARLAKARVNLDKHIVNLRK